MATKVFGDAVRLVADALGLELDSVRCEAEYAQTTEDLDLGSWSIPAGLRRGCRGELAGDARRSGRGQARRPLAQGPHLEPDWQIEHGYVVDIQGQPCVRTKLEVYPAADFVAKSFSDYMVLGMIMTALPAINAIPHVAARSPGIVTYLDLPLVTPAGWVP